MQNEINHRLSIAEENAEKFAENQSQEKKIIKWKNTSESMAQNQKTSCMFHWSPWERGKEETKNIWRNNDQIFPNLIKTIKPQIQGAQQITNSKNTKEAKPRLSIFTISIQDWTSSSTQYNNARHKNKMK